MSFPHEEVNHFPKVHATNPLCLFWKRKSQSVKSLLIFHNIPPSQKFHYFWQISISFPPFKKKIGAKFCTMATPKIIQCELYLGFSWKKYTKVPIF